MKCHVEQTDD